MPIPSPVTIEVNPLTSPLIERIVDVLDPLRNRARATGLVRYQGQSIAVIQGVLSDLTAHDLGPLDRIAFVVVQVVVDAVGLQAIMSAGSGLAYSSSRFAVAVGVQVISFTGGQREW